MSETLDMTVYGPRELYDQIGVRYERGYAKNEFLIKLLKRIATSSMLKPGARVLDVGCGTGRPVVEELTKAGLCVTGFDISPVMLKQAKLNIPSAKFFEADVAKVEFGDGTFEAVTAFFSLFHMNSDEIDNQITKIARWIVPGGLFILATVPKMQFPWPSENGHHEDGAPIRWFGKLSRATSFTAEEWVYILGNASLEVLETHETNFLPDDKEAVSENQLIFITRRIKHDSLESHL